MKIVKYGGKTYVKSIALFKKHASNKITTVIARRFACRIELSYDMIMRPQFTVIFY